MPLEADVAHAAQASLFVPLPETLVGRVLAAPPFVVVPGVHNVRDVGLCGAGNVAAPAQAPAPAMQPGRIFRSATLHQISAAGAAELARLGITKVFDLRSERERTSLATPATLLAANGIEVEWLPPAREPSRLDPRAFTCMPRKREEGAKVQETDAAAGQGAESGYEGKDEDARAGVHAAFAEMYEDILGTHVPMYRRVFEHVLSMGVHPGQHCLFHCQAGKDRTGVLAALMLDLAGTPHEVIAQDYSLTRIGLEPGRATLLDPREPDRASSSAHHADAGEVAAATAAASAVLQENDLGRDQENSRAAKGSGESDASRPQKLTLDPRSADFVAGLKQAIAHGAPQAPMDYFVEGMFRSDQTSMAMFLDRLRTAHGGAHGYLTRQLGFTPDQVDQIRSQLLL